MILSHRKLMTCTATGIIGVSAGRCNLSGFLNLIRLRVAPLDIVNAVVQLADSAGITVFLLDRLSKSNILIGEICCEVTAGCRVVSRSKSHNEVAAILRCKVLSMGIIQCTVSITANSSNSAPTSILHFPGEGTVRICAEAILVSFRKDIRSSAILSLPCLNGCIERLCDATTVDLSQIVLVDGVRIFCKVHNLLCR